MFRQIICRSFHCQRTVYYAAKSEKSPLARLRGDTGFAISNCKKALVMHNDDYDKALTWLNEQAQKEGWKKAEKLHGRATAQGLIGMLTEQNSATLVEVNCETDFVSRNKEFIELVSSVARICHSHNLKQLPAVEETGLAKNEGRCDQILATVSDESNKKTLSDLFALKIGLMGENLTLRRSLSIKIPNNCHIGWYTHPVTNESSDTTISLGKYGALVAFKMSKSELNANLTVQQCGKQLAKHIIGMNPKNVGLPYIPDQVDLLKENEKEMTDNVDSLGEDEKEMADKSHDSDGEDATNSSAKDDETRMLYQEFLSDSSMHVGDFVNENGIEILDFVRFECGEILSSE